MVQDFSIIAVLQGGRIAREAVVFMESLRRVSQTAQVQFYEPEPGPLWKRDPTADAAVHKHLKDLGAEIHSFTPVSFGEAYPHGNKIEAMCAAPANTPFVFFDTDTLFLDDPVSVPYPFDRPTASSRVAASWPKEGEVPISHVWRALYKRFGLDFGTSQDKSFKPNDWRRYLYFNAGFICGSCPQRFGTLMRDKALSVWSDPPPELEGQALTPWLDQIVLPLVIHELGGGRSASLRGLIDGSASVHWRWLPLLYVREAEAALDVLEEVAMKPDVRALLEHSDAFAKLVYGGAGRKLRAELTHLADDERALRRSIKAAGLWLR